MLAAGDPIINEFVANNNNGLLDDYNVRSDWIEVHNPGTTNAVLTDWHLTDAKGNPAKWSFPAGTTIAPGGYLVVFADARPNSIGPGGKLHTNFSLSTDGEYLALTRPDNTVASVFNEYPKQLGDISYGPGPAAVTQVTAVNSGAAAKTFIPGDNTLGTNWTALGFDDSAWIAGNTGVGFEVPVSTPGFLVRMVDTNGGTDSLFSNISEAIGVLDGPLVTSGAFTVGYDGVTNVARINFGDPGAFTGVANPDQGYPNGVGAGTGNNAQAGREEFAVRVTANVFIPAGTWSIDVGSDEGFKLKINGITFTNRVAEEFSGATNPSPADTLVYGGRRTFNHTSASFTIGAGGLSTTMQLDYYDRTATDALELSVATGVKAYTTSNAASFALLGNNVTPPGGAAFTVNTGAVASYAGQIATNIPQMQNANASAYVRVPFVVGDLTNLSALTLRMKYDDGFAAYLNGQLIATRNAPGGLGYNSTATIDRANASALVFEDIDVSAFKNLLVSGDNVLAIHALNSGAGNNDLFIMPELRMSFTTPPGLQYMTTPTPSAANVGGALGITKDTSFSVDRGFYDAPFDVVISTKQPAATIWYTLDGRSPLNTNGTVSSFAVKYTNPIHVTTTTTLRAAAVAPGYLNSDIDTETYIFLQDVIHQSNSPAGYPTQWINTSNVAAPGNFPVVVGQGADYEMDPEIVNDPAYSQKILDGLKAIPSVSVVMNVDDLFGNGSAGTNGIRGIYSNPLSSDSPGQLLWERATSVEMMFPDGTEGFQIDAGIQVQGNASRQPEKSPKHGFRLLFKDRYGATTLNYPLFEGSEVDKFDVLILKAGFNNTWHHWDGAQRKRAQYVHDTWASITEQAMGNAGKDGRYVHLYLNGLYWGMYSLTERPEASWASSHQGGEAADWDIYANEAVLLEGNSTAWNQMFTIANGPGGAAAPTANWLADDANYNELKKVLDIPSFINYMMLNYYGANADWDDHNWYAVRRSRVNGVATDQFGGFQFIVFDTERILEGVNDNRLGLNSTGRATRLFQQLKANADFRMQFADAVHKQLYNGGALSTAVAKTRYLAQTSQIEDAVIAESARWGDYRRDVHQYQAAPYELYTRNNQWLAEKNRLTVDDPATGTANDFYFATRPTAFISQLRSAGLYPTIDAPELNQFGGNVSPSFNATLTIPPGSVVYYTTDGSDPRLPGGGINPNALTYSGAFNIGSSKRIIARAYVAASLTWSASTDATFFVGPPPALRITEMNYNPRDPLGGVYLKDDFEYLEFQNTGATPLDPSGIRFADGIEFVFPDGSPLIPAGGRIIIVRNPAAFASRYGGAIPIAGTYTGELSDSGERITLTTGLGQLIENFSFKDGWYDQTDGDGFTLVANDPNATDAVLSMQEGWRSSQGIDGLPGAADPGLANNSIIINEVMSNATGDANWIELRNTTGGAIDISGWYFSDDKLNRQKFTIAAGTVIPANGFISFAQIGGFGGAFTLSGLGGAIYLTSNDGASGIGGYRDAIDYGPADPNVSFGKHVKSTGGSDFTAMSIPTRDAANAYPLVGPVVINEIMYNPFGLGREYVEIRNITDSAIQLEGWVFEDGINFTFPAGATLGANAYALIVPIDPAAYRTQFNIPASVAIFGPYTGLVDNAGEKLTLSKPGAPINSITPLITVDRVNYDNNLPWPAPPDGSGPSLGKINAIRYGNDVANWRSDAATGTGGLANSNPVLLFSSTFGYASPPTIKLKFSKDVAATLAASDLAIVNLTTGQPFTDGGSFAYDALMQTATWTLPASLADANYRATMLAASVTDNLGQSLDANGDGIAGDNLVLDFFHLGGDASRDRVVDHLDFNILYANFGKTNQTFENGDLNFDGVVNFADFQYLERRFGATLPLPAPALPQGAKKPVTAAPPKPVAVKKPAAKVVPKPVVIAPPLPFAKKRVTESWLRSS